VKVNISVHGRWHAFELANGLHRRGAMGRLFTTYPAFVARRFLASDVEIRTRPLLELRRRFYDRWQIGAKPDLAIAKAFARHAATVATSQADILVSWSGAALEVIAPAHAAGMAVVLERGSTHIRNQVRVLSEAYAEFGLAYDETSPEMVAREVAEYGAADAIAIATEYAAETFIAEGVSREKLIVNPYGVDLSRFVPSADRISGTRSGRPIRILFAGRVGIRKGVPWLLEAAQRLGQGTELHLVGPIDPEASAFLATRGSNVVVRGPLPFAALAAEYAQTDIFCLPSLEEGGIPMTVLHAMASGLPVVVTPAACGPIRDGYDGLVVGLKSADDIAAAVDRLIGSREERRAMGEAARATVMDGFSWQAYADRALVAYTRLLAARRDL
jgi:glycosyltransferase involved in cell wall biosynthesis